MIPRGGKNFDDDMQMRFTDIGNSSTNSARAQSGRITLVFAAHDKMHNHAIVLRDILLGRTEARNDDARSN